ncbi:LysR family transcriptional regulator [Vibrio renipiscarius]|uniref:Transcriptional regulator n=1 Tax=Vibrio renipiscarius TaxID=1461322 RepID=A0A0C2KA11_9VIBR|nr:LysR family transcriptional regulator [Vibrio renipiscarius]KII75415.1 transcriptional regulator [Vibrio renipiscarius]KII78868.1 transcriptional regulator [Vibrio renipiscarius]
MQYDYNLLKLILVLNDTQQTVAAARTLRVSQPTISVMLKKLREQFDDELFVRDKTQLKPTAKCLKLIDLIPNILEQLEGLYSIDKSWAIEELKGEVQLLFPPTMMRWLAAPLISKLAALAPKLTIDCRCWSEDAILKLETNTACWGVGYLPMETNKNLIETFLGYDKFELIMRHDHPLTESNLTQLREYPLCINLIPGYIESSKAEMLIKKYHLNKHINLRSSDLGLMLDVVKESDFIGIASTKCRSSLSDAFRCEPLPVELYKDTFRRSFSLFTHLKNKHDPLTQWLQVTIESIIQQQLNEPY